MKICKLIARCFIVGIYFIAFMLSTIVAPVTNSIQQTATVTVETTVETTAEITVGTTVETTAETKVETIPIAEPSIVSPIEPSIAVPTKPPKIVSKTTLKKPPLEMIQVVQLEAGGNYKNDLAVACVILNRLDSGLYGNTIYAVVSASGQFSVWHNHNKAVITDNAMRACTDALNGKRTLPSNVTQFRSAHYYNKHMSKTEKSKYIYYNNIGDNVFLIVK